MAAFGTTAGRTPESMPAVSTWLSDVAHPSPGCVFLSGSSQTCVSVLQELLSACGRGLHATAHVTSLVNDEVALQQLEQTLIALSSKYQVPGGDLEITVILYIPTLLAGDWSLTQHVNSALPTLEAIARATRFSCIPGSAQSSTVGRDVDVGTQLSCLAAADCNAAATHPRTGSSGSCSSSPVSCSQSSSCLLSTVLRTCKAEFTSSDV